MALHDQRWPFMTQKGPKTLLMGMIDDIMSYWTTMGPIQRPTGAQNGPKQHQNGPKHHQSGPLGPKKRFF